MITLLTVLLLPAVAFCLLCGAYLLLLTLLSAPLPPVARARKPWRFVVVVPAHDEELVIERTVRSLMALDWPREHFQVCVVADNCSDATAELAEKAGAKVLVRQDSSLRGKGYALRHAYEHWLAQDWTDAVVVVDADSEVSANLLGAFAARLDAGAGAVQAYYGVLNPDASWRTRLMHIAYALIHRLRSRGRERLGVSSGLRGNGMCFTAETLRRVPHRSFSVMEDLEYAIQLADAGIGVAYADEAEAAGEMVTGEKSSRSQRQRWEGGRGELRRTHLGRQLRRGLSGDRMALDLAMDLLVPPLAQLGAATLLVFFGAAALAFAGGSGLPLWGATFALLALLLYVARGWQISGTGLQGLRDLARAPIYLLWKLTLLVRGNRRPGEWVRTDRGQGR